MDNITHTLTGLMLSRAGLNRLTPHATAVVLLAANAADIDVVAAFDGPVRYLQYHRGITHSLFAIPLLALLAVAVVRLAARKPLPWLRAWLAAAIGAASNPLLDWTNVYGVKLLSPLSERWFRADLFHIVDVWIWAAFILALAAPAISKLVSAEIGARPAAGRGAAIFALCFLALYGFTRYLLHDRAVAILEARMYQNEAPRRVAALPTPVNPFRWVGLVEGGGFYQVNDGVNVLAEFDPADGRVFYKPEPGPALEAARQTDAFRVFLAFSQYPLWRVTPVAEPENGKLVQAFDLRFGAPPEERFAATALLDGELRVLRASFAFGGRPGPTASGR